MIAQIKTKMWHKGTVDATIPTLCSVTKNSLQCQYKSEEIGL